MRKISLQKEYMPEKFSAGAYQKAWQDFEKEWRGIVEGQGCALVRVKRIKGLAARTVRGPAGSEKGWVVTYEVGGASVKDYINPPLVIELLQEELVGKEAGPEIFFIVNESRVEEVLVVEAQGW